MVSQIFGAIGMGATIAGGSLSAKGAFEGGLAQEQQSYYQAGIAKLNSAISKQNEEFALNQGEQEASRYGISARERIGGIRAAQGASGLDVNTGSAKDVQESQKTIAHLDTDTIRANAAKVAYDYDVQSIQFGDQARLYEMAGNNQAVAGGINAEASAIGTVASVASKWSQGSQVGLFSPGGMGDSASNMLGDAAGVAGFNPFGSM
jgi:hypothetical protein